MDFAAGRRTRDFPARRGGRRGQAMKMFHCGHCDQLVFFENTNCVSCGHVLAYLPDRRQMGTLEPGEGDLWRALPSAAGVEERSYRLCRNYREENVCNWAIPADDGNPLC